MADENIVNDDTQDDGAAATETSAETSGIDLPGRRINNPLGAYSSYTYQISLYMITPTAYDAFTASGRTSINALADATGNPVDGVTIVAQSGGIHNATANRVSNLDYFIDDLSIKSLINGKATTAATTNTEIKFKITEPYGFSFLSDLKRAADELYEDTEISYPQNPTRQFFVLGVKFIGYDKNGNIVSTGTPNLDQNGEITQPIRIPDHYYDIIISDIKFRIDGSAVVYDVTAVGVSPRVAFGIMRGMLNSNTTVVGASVEDAVDGIIDKLNKDQERIAERSDNIPVNTYSVRWQGLGADDLKNASILSSTGMQDFLNKHKFPGIAASNAIQVTEAAGDAVDTSKNQIIFKNDTPVLEAIAEIITQSQYLTKALEKVYASSNQPDPVTGDYKSLANNPTKINWYNVSADVKNATWVPEIADYVYHIEYVIQPYETPVVQSPYGLSSSLYYGPFKRYDYWYTGKNSEVLSYEQRIDNGYFTVYLDSLTDSMLSGEASYGDGESSVVGNRTTDESRVNSLGPGRTAQNTIVTSLFDPGSFAQAKIVILGDPDLLMYDAPYPIDTGAFVSRFYGPDGFSVNPTSGQVFIEIDFKEARDYDLSAGHLSINDKILFWQYPNTIEANRIRGISYMIVDVLSEFRGGMFKQTLNCIINPMSMTTPRRIRDQQGRDDADTVESAANDYVELGPPVPDTNQSTPEN